MREARPGSANRGDPRLAFPPDNHVVRFRAWVQDCQIFWTRPLIAWSCQTQNRQFQTEENMANNSTRSAKTKVIHAGFLLADPDTQPKSEQSILIEGERIKAVSGGFIDPPPGGELIDLRKKFVLPVLIDCHVHLTAQLDRGYRLRRLEES